MGCSNDDTTPDLGSGHSDAGSASDTQSFYACDTPGEICNAHDNCAIDPVCGDDLRCRPMGYQDCSDDLACTEDTCGGLGSCENTPQLGFCVIRVRQDGKTTSQCFSDGELDPQDPCRFCDAEADPKGWSDRNGGACDDGNPCTKGDYCQDGLCRGTDYSEKCDDALFCTIDCDGEGGCKTELDRDSCLIDDACHRRDDPGPTGCETCDPDESTSSWTPLGRVCLIDGTCKQPGVLITGGCAECDPEANATGWTMKVSDKCLIDGLCVAKGDQDSLGCNQCSPDDDAHAWTPLSGRCSIDGKCYETGEANPKADCTECDPVANPKGWTVSADNSGCFIDGACWQADDATVDDCDSCQPSVDKYAWSPMAGRCKIWGTCHDDSDDDATGCMSCATGVSTSTWTAKAGVTQSEEGFEQSSSLPAGWTETHEDVDHQVKWRLSDKVATSGTTSLHYGNATAESYDTAGRANGGRITLGQVVLPAEKSAALSFNLWLDVETQADFDVLVVEVDGKVVWHKKQLPSTIYKSWVQQVVDLSAYAGKTVEISFFFHTMDHNSNNWSGVFLDDVALLTDC
ncbi:MAG: choice-of-anchor J domain-containing protein [Deltaproteobacteria bacterium]|nr:choice-of-anchor J domain-containing protein [Deltaproteobacteria bacterium]